MRRRCAKKSSKLWDERSWSVGNKDWRRFVNSVHVRLTRLRNFGGVKGDSHRTAWQKGRNASSGPFRFNVLGPLPVKPGAPDRECLVALTLHPLAHQLPVTTHSFSLLTRLAL